MYTIAILTNARAADQRSMIGYGNLLLEGARRGGYKILEFQASSFFGQILPVSVQGKPRKLANNLDRFLATPLKMLGRRADIVHVVDPGNIIYLPIIRHRRSIVTIHDMIPYLARDGQLPGWRPSRAGRLLMKWITANLAKVNHAICVSHATKRDFSNYVDVSGVRISVLHNAVFQPMSPASPEVCKALRVRLGLPKDVPLILHVGRGFYKNRETVLEVVARVRKLQPDVHLVMVGELSSALMDRAIRLGLTDALHVLSRVSSEDMAALYTTVALLLFPSLYEGFGLPVLEARLCGTHVVCSDRGSLPEVAHPGSLCDPNSTDTMVNMALNALHKNCDLLDLTKSSSQASSTEPDEWCAQNKLIYEYECSCF